MKSVDSVRIRNADLKENFSLNVGVILKHFLKELYVPVVVNFLSQVIFIFLLFQLHQHILPYPKTKEKQKLPEIKN